MDDPRRRAGSRQGAGFPECAEWILILLVLATVVLVYPLRLKETWQRELFGNMALSEGRLHQICWSVIEPFLNFYCSPLILKGSLAGILMLLFIAATLIRRVLAPVQSHRACGEGQRAHGWQWISMILFLIWALVGIFWSPTPRLSGSCAWWLMIYMCFWFILMQRGFSGIEKIRLVKVFILLGTPVLILIFMEAFPVFANLTYSIFHHFEDKRNRFGSLLGHNSAAASFLLMTWFPVMAGTLKSASRVFHLAGLVYLCACLMAFVILQTRAVWILAPILCFLFLRSSFRCSSLRFRPIWVSTLFLAVVALIIVSQVINHPSNPFYVKTDTLAERLKDISPAGMAEESRLRLNIISLGLVPQRLFRGHGLYAYQYVYPREQGLYFLQHPDSSLHQTIARSHMAHNEYLQVLIDHGLIGLFLLGWIYRDILRKGLHRNRRLSGPDRILHASFGWSSMAIALHAFVDFPFHVPQLLIIGMIVSAAWAGGADPDTPGKSPEISDPVGPEREGFLSSKFRLEYFARLLFSFILVGLIPVAVLPFKWNLESDVQYARGTAHLNQVYMLGARLDPAEKVRYLKKAIHHFEKSIRALPTNYLSMLKASDAYLHLGRHYAAQDSMDPVTKKLAFKEFMKGLDKVDQSAKGLDYHGVYFQRGQIFGELYKLEPSSEFSELYIGEMRESLKYCQMNTRSAYLLAEFLTRQSEVDMEAVNQLRRQVQKFDPVLFEHQYLHKAYRFIDERRFRAAALAREQILSIDHDNPVWMIDAARANLLDGNLGRARELIRLVESRHPRAMYLYGGGLIMAALDPGADGMGFLIQLSNSRTELPGEQAFFRAIELEAIKRTDHYRHAEKVAFERPSSVNKILWDGMVRDIRPYVLLHYFREPDAARKAIDQILDDKIDVSIEVLLDGFYVGLSQGDPDFSRTCLDDARRLDPRHPALQELTSRFVLEMGSDPPEVPGG